VDDRLLALMWMIAERTGIVRPDGIFVPLAVTHETLACMIGAQRPTISLALTRLRTDGVLRADTGGWLIAHGSIDRLRLPIRPLA
jgi:CRP-like cAMP-binding protein